MKILRDLEVGAVKSIEVILRLFLAEKLAKVKDAALYLLYGRFFEPLNTFSLFPQAELDRLLRHGILAQTMLLAATPVALIFPAVRPCVNSEPVFLVILVVTFIHSTVLPGVYSRSMHIIVEPFALVLTAI